VVTGEVAITKKGPHQLDEDPDLLDQSEISRLPARYLFRRYESWPYRE